MRPHLTRPGRMPVLSLVPGSLAERAIADRERLFRQAEARRRHDALEAEIWADRSEDFAPKQGADLTYLILLIACCLAYGTIGGFIGFAIGRATL